MTKFGSAMLVVGALAFADVSFAAGNDSSTENVATARELYKAGADALDAGDAKGALEKLTAAWALAQTPVIGETLARAHLALGHLVDARESALAVARLPPAPNETARSTQARQDAEALAKAIAPRIPHVKLAVEGLASHHATIKLDNAIVPEAALAVARQTNPGTHAATVDTDDGRHGEGSVTVAEGETKDLVITLGPPAPDAPPPHDVTPISNPPSPTPIAPTSSTSPLVWVGIATTGVGVAVGAITGAFALSEASTVKANCTAKSPTDGALICGSNYTGDLSTAKTMATISTVGFVVGGVGVAVLVTGLILSGKKHTEKTAIVRPFVGPISGFQGSF
jgi:hypothetical protein